MNTYKAFVVVYSNLSICKKRKLQFRKTVCVSCIRGMVTIMAYPFQEKCDHAKMCAEKSKKN